MMLVEQIAPPDGDIQYQYLIVLKDLLSYGQAFERVKLLLIMMIRDHATSPRIVQQLEGENAAELKRKRAAEALRGFSDDARWQNAIVFNQAQPINDDREVVYAV